MKAEKENMNIDQIISDGLRDGLNISLTPSGSLRVFGDDPVLEKYRAILESRCEEIIAALKEHGSGKRELIIGDVGACPHCGSIKTPPPITQIDRLKTFQLNHSDYWHWSDDQLQRLRAEMERESGSLIVEIYAHSVILRLANGALRNYPKTES
jgi:hypothetical protein